MTALSLEQVETYAVGTGVPSEVFTRARTAAAESALSPVTALIELGLLSEPDLLEAQAALAKVDIISDIQIDLAEAEKLGWTFLETHTIAPHSTASAPGSVPVLVTCDLTQDFALKALDMAYAGKFELKLAPRQLIADTLKAARTQDHSGLGTAGLTTSLDVDLTHLKELASEAPIIQLSTNLIAKAVDVGATDIHVEPGPKTLTVRYRIDGQLADRQTLNKDQQTALISRLKLLAGVDIAETRLPQDGRMKLTGRGRRLDIRLATLPGQYGEGLVLRVLDQTRVQLDLERLGYGDDDRELLDSLIAQPYGLILVTGPTGSGKTTTLYSLLDRMNAAKRKIITIEDPVEYEKPELLQVQVKPSIGLTFPKVLRATLRHDPDVLLIGEIRDGETAKIAVEAALTGHLVLATLHTNSAASAPARLMDMGVEPYLLAATLSAVIGQRLLPKLCMDCKAPDEQAKSLLPGIFNKFPDIDQKVQPNIMTATGCETCRGTGYHGRRAVYEILQMSDAMRSIVAAGDYGPDLAATSGMMSMQRFAVAAALRGEIDLRSALSLGGSV